jgi:hypothetical protein
MAKYSMIDSIQLKKKLIEDMVGLTVDDDFSHSFSLAHRIASRADVAPSIGNGDSTELQKFQGRKR